MNQSNPTKFGSIDTAAVAVNATTPVNATDARHIIGKHCKSNYNPAA
jgi:hypothetical protein